MEMLSLLIKNKKNYLLFKNSKDHLIRVKIKFNVNLKLRNFNKKIKFN